MPSDQLRCSLCTLVKSIHDFSRSSRKLEEPACKRCTAWTETQEPTVVPAPLETGHVSPEEQRGDPWQMRINTDEAFAPGDDHMPRAPITSGASLGLDSEEQVELEAIVSNASAMDLDGTASEASTRPRTLPPHLRGTGSAVPSASSSEAGDFSSAASTANSVHRSLPPHFRDRFPGPSSISTATTIRLDREEAKKSKAIEYNAFAPDGVMHQRTRYPSTVASSITSEASRQSTPADQQPSRARGGFREVKAQVAPPPTHQMDRNPQALIGSARYHDPGANWQTRLTFCQSDDEGDYDN